MADRDHPLQTPKPPSPAKSSSTSPTETRHLRESLNLRQPSFYSLGSPPGTGTTIEGLGSPLTPSRRTERIFPISSVVNPGSPTGSGTEPLNTRSSSGGLWSASTPTPFVESGNPFEGEKIYHSFNEELERQRATRDLHSARRIASAGDTSGAQNLGLLQHPMTMRFQHKETDDGHCVVTVSLFADGG